MIFMRQTGKKLYQPQEAYMIVYRALRSFLKLKKAVQSGILDEKFKERIMLAVTKVNGCAMCSYAHTQMALESGMAHDEILAMLNGELKDVPAEEVEAILFAQAYADQRGHPSDAAKQRIIQVYGKEKTEAILAAIHVIMAGNTYGIIFGSLKGRITKEKDKIDQRSSLFYEIMMILLLIIYLPIAFIHACIGSLLHIPIISM